MANSIVALKQQTFATAMLTLLTEGRGGKLASFCETEENAVGTTHTFYRMDASSTSDDINYYDAAYVGTAGDTIKVVVTPALKYSHGFLKEKELMETNVDIKSSYSKSFKNALDRAEDAVIINSLVSQGANLTHKGDDTKTLAEQMNQLIQAIAYATALADDNEDHANVAVAINKQDYARLFMSDKFTSSDFNQITDAGTTLAGGLLVPTDAVAQGNTYIIPNNVVGLARFKGGAKAIMEYDKGKDGYVIWARKSFGAGLGDEDAPSVILFSSNGLDA